MLFSGEDAQMWDAMHSDAEKSDQSGGRWHYSESSFRTHGLQRYMRSVLAEESNSSVLDVACSVGVDLHLLEGECPDCTLYGSDISRVMVEATEDRCGSCRVQQFDIGQMQFENARYDAFAGVSVFDYVMVSDVLLYIEWGGWKPVWFALCSLCSFFAQGYFRAFATNIAALARRQVIFSSHQNNSVALWFFEATGARHLENYDVYVLPGTAS